MTLSAENIQRAKQRPGFFSRLAKEGWFAALGISLTAGLLIVAPFFWLGVPSGHDIGFHAGSWIDVAGQWREGILYPRWSEWANHGFGEPRFIFYPPLSWMLGAALGLVAPWPAAPAIFVVLAQMMAGLAAFALARRMISKRAALFAAFCYAANPYALLVTYLRSDFAELLAVALFPVLILAACELSGVLECRTHTVSRNIAVFGILFAAVWLSNAPAGVLASYTAALLLAWGAMREKNWRPLALGAGGLALGFGLAAVYILPAAYEQRWVNIAQAVSAGLLPRENFLFTRTDDAEHTAFNWLVSETAVAMIVFTGLAAFVTWRRATKETRTQEDRKFCEVLVLLSATAILLMLRISAILWHVLPELRFLQFPWRWMSILAVAFAVFLAAAVTERRHAWIWIAMVVLTLGGIGVLQTRLAFWGEEDFADTQAWVEQGDGFEGTDEYDPAGDDHTDLPAKMPQAYAIDAEGQKTDARGAIIQIQRWTAEKKIVHVDTKDAVRIALRLVDYPAWEIEVNGKPIIQEHAEGTRQIVVPLAAGEWRIDAKFTRTWDRTTGGVISMGSLGVALLLLKRRKGMLAAG